ncbi:hypothetical protein [Enterobacter bugandensis]|uniref:hypothetical protein n=1 Tax=Enterobacter bugandensis TaxID=881260 RepID=UPI0006651B9F|nr:hypothetical protein [Enterobacter bugandensis]
MKSSLYSGLDSLLTLFPLNETLSSTSVHEWFAHINTGALHQQLFDAPENGLVRLQLSDSQDYLLTTSFCERVNEHCVSWRGSVPGTPDVRVYLSAVARPGETTALAGYLSTGTSSLSFDTQADGTVSIRIPATGRNSLSARTCCSGHSPVQVSSAENNVLAEAVTSEYASLSAAPAESAVIRLLALYPQKTLDETGGQTPFEAKMLLGASLASEAFANSRINARVEMAFQQENDLKGTDKDQGVIGYVDQVGQSPALAKRIEDALSTHKADLAVLVVGESPNGIFGYTPVIPEPPTTTGLTLKSRMFAVALKWKPYMAQPGEMDLIGDRNTLTHELGHALGAKHDRFTQPDYEKDAGLDPKYDYVRGYVPDDHTFTTVMGYPGKTWDAVRLNYFSGPELEYHGRALGTPVGQPYAADAASFLRLSTQVVAKYKGAADPHPNLYPLTLKSDPDLAGVLQVDAPGPYLKDSVVNVKATPRAGSFVFKGWMLDGKPVGGDEPTVPVKMDQSHTLSALFDTGQARHAITVRASDPGMMSVNIYPKPDVDGKYADGTTVSVDTLNESGNPDKDWALLGWLVDGRYAGNGPELFLRVDGNHDVTALVGKRQHQLTWRTIPDNARELLYVAGYADVAPSYPEPMTPARVADGQPFRFVASGDFDRWRVNGKDTAEHFHELSLECLVDTRVEALFNGWEKALKLTVRTNYFDIYPDKTDFSPWISWAKSPDMVDYSPLMAYSADTGAEQIYWISPQTYLTVDAATGEKPKGISVDGKQRVPGDRVSFVMQHATDVFIEY